MNKAETKPNILIFFVDDMGYSDIAAFGSPNVSTPHLDALVGSGMKFTNWVSAAAICTPSRASLQTGRYPIRTGCMGNNEGTRVVAPPSTSGGLDPAEHMSIAAALKQAGYATGMAGKWHLGINSNLPGQPQDFRYTPNAHSYDTYFGVPFSNCEFCKMDANGISNYYKVSQQVCFLMSNRTVVQQPLKIENATDTLTKYALKFLEQRGSESKPWFFFMSYLHGIFVCFSWH